MPPQVQQSSVFSKIAAQAAAAHEAHKNDEVSLGFTNLPAGISSGVAQLKSITGGVYKSGQNKDKPYALIQATIKSPKEHGGIPVEGLLATVTCPLADTVKQGKPVPFATNYAEFLNELKKLGADLSKTTAAQIPAIVDAFNKMTPKPHTRFSTRGWTPPPTKENPKPTEMIFTEFQGVCDWTGDMDSPGAATADDTAAPTEPAPIEPDANPEGFGLDTTAAAGDSAGEDLDVLAAQAVDDDDAVSTAAQNQLETIAVAAGISKDDVTKAADWPTLVAMIRAAQETPGAAAPAAASAFVPTVGHIYFYTVLDPKTGKPAVDKKKKPLPPVETKVTAVNAAKQTANVLNLDDKKTVYKDVPFAQLGAGK